MAQKFKFMPSVKLRYAEQGYIYFVCQRYRHLDEGTRAMIRGICRDISGGDRFKEQAILCFMTTGISWVACCQRYYISDAGLDRLRRRFFMRWKEVSR